MFFTTFTCGEAPYPEGAPELPDDPDDEEAMRAVELWYLEHLTYEEHVEEVSPDNYGYCGHL